jgi:dipeptidyl aminopeptidase/acylaminoacyl peptidase
VHQRFACACATVALLVAASPPAAERRVSRPPAKPALDRLLSNLGTVEYFHEVVVSPDGHRVAWVGPPERGGASASAVYVADLREPDARPRRVTAGDGGTSHHEHGIAWSPDGKRLAFLSDKARAGQPQLYVAPVAGGEARKLTDLTGLLARPRWSPDGKRLALLFTENPTRAAGPLQPGARAGGVIEEDTDEQRLYVLDAASGHGKFLSPADLYVYEYDWSPDGRTFAMIAAHGNGDNNWYIAQLYTLASDSGEMKSILKPRMQIAVPRWSPDGKSVAFIGGLMSDEGANGGDIYTVPAAGGTPRDVTPGLKASASWLAWLPSGQIVFTETVDGHSGIARVSPSGGPVEDLWKGAESIVANGGEFSIALSREGNVSALIRQSFTQPPEVWAGPIGKWRQLTHANSRARSAWGKARSVHWKSGPWQVQGWLLYPRDYEPDRRSYPMVVSVHGGPAWAVRPFWPGTFFDLAVLSAQGYFVFYPNPRGSYGQGEAFTRANVKDFGGGDLRDILAGVDEVEKTAKVDPQRLGIAGWSYGGFMTMWAVTQTNRFRAAVAGAGIANWQSYYGENGIDQWLLPYFGASVYDDPAVYAKSSPINFIKRVRTPTLVLVGERDLECPAPQSHEFWHALKTLGVRTQLVVYPDEGHQISQWQHRRDIMRRTVGWLKDNLRALP